ncbi:MAG: regulatory protein RecX [Burkholderiaceae bacterium]|nr:regulatory protein RecX [Burkholderiaceae bacterium]
MKKQLSLKGRALQLLAQREHSRLELRRKLLRRLRDDGNSDVRRASGSVAGVSASVDLAATGSRSDPEAEVDALLDWLHNHRYLSDERFVESRVHARSARHGNLRIRQELSQHGVVLTPALAGALRDSEHARALEVQQRKFGGPPDSLTERARQARFLAARGFSSDVVSRVLRASGRRGDDSVAMREEPDAGLLQAALPDDDAY